MNEAHLICAALDVDNSDHCVAEINQVASSLDSRNEISSIILRPENSEIKLFLQDYVDLIDESDSCFKNDSEYMRLTEAYLLLKK